MKIKVIDIMNWFFHMPVKIVFGSGIKERLKDTINEFGFNKGVLISDPIFIENGCAENILQISDGILNSVFSNITANPTTDNADECAEYLRFAQAEFAVALGGGSAIDCAKAACAIAKSNDSIRAYHTGGNTLNKETGIPLIVMPTTAGTGSEVTSVSVLTDTEKKKKAPLGSPCLYPSVALIDPTFTLSVPGKVTASTGLDVISHALEGFWSVHHQPVCDALAISAAKTAFEYLPEAYDNPSDLNAREKMCEASLLAGIAFSHPKTSGPHACSFPLTNVYGLPHGEACAFTLDTFIMINASAENGRLHTFAKACGFGSACDMADTVRRLKKLFGMPSTLAEAGIAECDIERLSLDSMHPNMLNNPVQMDVKAVEKVYRTIG